MQKLSTSILCIILTLLVIIAGGCGPARKTLVGLSKEEILNNEAVRESAINWLQVWPMQSGFIHGLMAHRQGEFPEHVVDAINELDDLALSMSGIDPNDMLDYDLGLSLGLRVRLLGAVVEETVKAYSPDMLDLIPLLF